MPYRDPGFRHHVTTSVYFILSHNNLNSRPIVYCLLFENWWAAATFQNVNFITTEQTRSLHFYLLHTPFDFCCDDPQLWVLNNQPIIMFLLSFERVQVTEIWGSLCYKAKYVNGIKILMALIKSTANNIKTITENTNALIGDVAELTWRIIRIILIIFCISVLRALENTDHCRSQHKWRLTSTCLRNNR